MNNDNTSGQGGRSLARLTAAFMPYIRKRAGGLRAAGLERDDLEQEGLIGLYDALTSFDETRGGEFSSYALACINNRMTSAVRQAARKKNLPLSGYLSLSGDDAMQLEGGGTPEDIAIAREDYLSLQNRINCDLSRFEREVLSLYLEGYDYLSVAERLGCSAKSADNALQRARRKLKPRQ